LKTKIAAVAIAVVVIVVAGVAATVLLRTPSGSLVVGVKDSPAGSNVSHIYLTITDITLQNSGNASVSYKVNATTFDLLALQNVTKMLGKDSIPAGNYTMVRFGITAAVATVSGTNVTLTVPSGQVKVPMRFSIASGKTTTIVLEISADMTAISTSQALRPVVTGQETVPPT
jgi:metal-dependent HD superfamily phosphatase/phosphodiesterase